MRKLIWLIRVFVIFLPIIQHVPTASAQQDANFFQFPVSNYFPSITQSFGDQNSDFLDNGKPKQHVADDIDGIVGKTQVVSAANGKVMLSFSSDCERGKGGWGHVLVIEHKLPNNNGFITTIYRHLDANDIKVEEGKDIEIGQILGTVGKYPCYGDHLHFGVRRGAFEAAVGKYPGWLHGYLKQEEFPENYCDPATYIIDGACTERPESGTIEVKRVDGTGATLPSSLPTTAAIDTGVEKTDNPAFFTNLLVSGNPYTVGATDRPEYLEEVATCDTLGCTLAPDDPKVAYKPATCDGIFCTRDVNALDGGLTRVVFLYDQCALGFAKSGIKCVPGPGNTLMFSGFGTLVLGQTTPLLILLRDPQGNPISNAIVALSSSRGNALSTTTTMTDFNGETSVVVTGTVAGTDTIQATALGAIGTFSLVVSAANFHFITPAANAQVNLGAVQTIIVHWDEAGVNQVGQTINFSATRGTLSAASAITNASGNASVTISSTTAGPSTITATAAATGGPGSQITIQFVGQGADSEPPTVAITAPPDNATIPGASTLFVIVVAASDNIDVARVEIRVDGVLKIIRATPPYTLVHALGSAGSHTIQATAFDDAGNQASASITVTALP